MLNQKLRGGGYLGPQTMYFTLKLISQTSPVPNVLIDPDFKLLTVAYYASSKSSSSLKKPSRAKWLYSNRVVDIDVSIEEVMYFQLRAVF